MPIPVSKYDERRCDRKGVRECSERLISTTNQIHSTSIDMSLHDQFGLRAASFALSQVHCIQERTSVLNAYHHPHRIYCPLCYDHLPPNWGHMSSLGWLSIGLSIAQQSLCHLLCLSRCSSSWTSYFFTCYFSFPTVFFRFEVSDICVDDFNIRTEAVKHNW